jgi:hypothetical protein
VAWCFRVAEDRVSPGEFWSIRERVTKRSIAKSMGVICEDGERNTEFNGMDSSTARKASTKLPLVPPRAGGMKPLMRPIAVACRRMGRVDWNPSGSLGRAAYFRAGTFQYSCRKCTHVLADLCLLRTEIEIDHCDGFFLRILACTSGVWVTHLKSWSCLW